MEENYIKFYSGFGLVILIIFCLLLFIYLIVWIISMIRSDTIEKFRFEIKHFKDLYFREKDITSFYINRYDLIFDENRKLKLKLDKLSKKKGK